MSTFPLDLQRLRDAIQRSGLKQQAIADALGMAPTTLSRYLNGKRVPHAAIVSALAQALGVSAAYLRGGPGDAPEPLVRLGQSGALADPPVVRELDPVYLPDAVALTGLGAEERQTMLRMLDALRSGDEEIRRHLIGQLKIIEVALNTRRKQPRKEQDGGA